MPYVVPAVRHGVVRGMNGVILLRGLLLISCASAGLQAVGLWCSKATTSVAGSFSKGSFTVATVKEPSQEKEAAAEVVA